MKKSLRNFLILLAVLVVGYVVYFIINLFKTKEAFTESEEQFIPIIKNVVDFFENVTKKDAEKVGFPLEAFDTFKKSISNNEPNKIIEMFSEHPEYMEKVNQLILNNRVRLTNNSNE